MDPLRDFDQHLAEIHDLNTHITVDRNSGGQSMDIRHSEFQAMADAFLGEHFDKATLLKVENLQMTLHEQQAVLYQRYEEGHIGPEEYVSSFNSLLDNIFTECEKILGQTDFEKLFRAPRSELAGFIDREAFLHSHQSRPQADKPPMSCESKESPSRMAAEASWLLMVCQDHESFAKATVFALNVCKELTTLSELVSDSLRQQDIPAIITIQSKRMLLPQPAKAAENLNGVVKSAKFQHIRKNLSEWAASPQLPRKEDRLEASETFARIAPILAESAI